MAVSFIDGSTVPLETEAAPRKQVELSRTKKSQDPDRTLRQKLRQSKMVTGSLMGMVANTFLCHLVPSIDVVIVVRLVS